MNKHSKPSGSKPAPQTGANAKPTKSVKEPNHNNLVPPQAQRGPVDAKQSEHPAHGGPNKSCCKVEGHGMQEIVFACYECSDTFCKLCI